MVTMSPERVIGSFDFEKVRAYMLLTNWVYATDSDNKVPTIAQLKDTARLVLHDALAYKTNYRTGGFHAWYWKNDYEEGLHLSFEIEATV